MQSPFYSIGNFFIPPLKKGIDKMNCSKGG